MAEKKNNIPDIKEVIPEKKSVFDVLNDINVNDKTEKKGKLTYLSWAWAWGQLKKNYPNANYKVYENADGWNYFTDGRTAWVKVEVMVNGLGHIEYLPIMDNQNRSIALDKITSFNVNTSIQRALTKAIARHGLGLYIYAGEDLPEAEMPVYKNEEITNKTYRKWLDNFFFAWGHEKMVDAFFKKYDITYLDELDKKQSLEQIDKIISDMKALLEKEANQ